MKVKLSNVGSIKNGTIELKDNALNVRYGANGIGKSTISKAIKLVCEGNELSVLTPFGSCEQPSVTIDNIKSVIQFDADYVNEYLFKSDLLNNSFELLINTTEYKNLKREIEIELNEFIKLVQNDSINKTINLLKEIRDTIKFNNDSTLSGSSKLQKSRNIGDITRRLKPEAMVYAANFISKNNYKWYKWFIEGKQYNLDEAKCPYCKQKLPNDFESVRSHLESTLKQTDVKSNAEMKEKIDETLGVISVSHNLLLQNAILTNHILTNEEQDMIFKFNDNLNTEIDKLVNLREFNPTTLKTQLVNGTLLNYLEINKPDMKFYDLENEKLVTELNELLKAIDKMISNVKYLEKLAKNFDNKIKETIYENSNYINEFLELSGIPYYVEIENHGHENFKSYLKPINAKEKVNEKSLSYGEKNAISLILFSLEVFSKEYSIVILDDPVSSFDSTKKYAMLYYLFLKENALLKNKTVLFFTHDFDIVIDLVCKSEFREFEKCCKHVTNKNGILNETKIIQKNLKKTFNHWEKNSKNNTISVIGRLVNLRKYIECIEGDNSASYHMLASLLHLKDEPDKQGVELSKNEREVAVDKISQYIEKFDYYNLLTEIKKNENLKKWYFDSKSDVEKLFILRVYLEVNQKKISKEDYNFMNFVNGAYHVENNELFSLNENQFSQVPQYIINICDDLICKGIPTIKKDKEQILNRY